MRPAVSERIAAGGITGLEPENLRIALDRTKHCLCSASFTTSLSGAAPSLEKAKREK